MATEGLDEIVQVGSLELTICQVHPARFCMTNGTAELSPIFAAAFARSLRDVRARLYQ
jgi:hypothetical protein